MRVEALKDTEYSQLYVFYFQGCYSVVTDFMKDNMTMIGGIALGISFFQVGIIIYCMQYSFKS